MNGWDEEEPLKRDEGRWRRLNGGALDKVTRRRPVGRAGKTSRGTQTETLRRSRGLVKEKGRQFVMGKVGEGRLARENAIEVACAGKGLPWRGKRKNQRASEQQEGSRLRDWDRERWGETKSHWYVCVCDEARRERVHSVGQRGLQRS